jgi:hypothetical protein
MTADVCSEAECGLPRFVLATGRVMSRCPEHHREYARRKDQRWRSTDEGRQRHNETSVESKRRAWETPEGRERMRDNNERGHQSWLAKPGNRERDRELSRQSHRRLRAARAGT